MDLNLLVLNNLTKDYALIHDWLHILKCEDIWATQKTLLLSIVTGWLIGILIMVYFNLPIIG